MRIFKGLIIVLAIVSVAFLIGCNGSEAPAKKAPATVEQATPAPAPAAVEPGTQKEEMATEPAAEGTEQKAEEPKTEEPKTENPEQKYQPICIEKGGGQAFPFFCIRRKILGIESF